MSNKFVLIVSILASSMAFIDSSALSVALPAVQRDLNSSALDLLWIVNGYNLPVSALILLGGSLGDRYGLKKIFSRGIALFVLSSLFCGLAKGSSLLITARFLQGIGGAFMIPGSLALISAKFEGAEKAKAIGTWSAFSTLTTILGPILGGLLADWGLWRIVFFINIPLGLVAFYLLRKKVTEVPLENEGKSLDWFGAFLITFSLGFLTLAFIGSDPTQGINRGQMILALLSVVLLTSFIFFEKGKTNALLPLHVFKSRTFSAINLMTVLLYATLYGVMFFVPLNLIQIQGYRESLAGLATLPTALLLTLISGWAGKKAGRMGPNLFLVLGPFLVGCGYLMYAVPGVTAGPSQYWISYFAPALLMGIGLGITVAPLTATVMNALPANRAGLASGINNAAARVAGVLALAVLGASVLLLFQHFLIENLIPLQLPAQALDDLKTHSSRLGGLESPPYLPQGIQYLIKGGIQISFIRTFRIVCFAGTLLAWLSALSAFFFLPKKASQGIQKSLGAIR